MSLRLSLVVLIIIIFSCLKLVAQSACNNLNNYAISQDWIRKLNNLSNVDRRDSILTRIQCERQLGDVSLFKLTFIINGLLIDSLPQQRDHLLKLVGPDNFLLLNSLCETKGIYPQKCNLGFVIVNNLEKPLINTFEDLILSKVTQSKHRLKLKLKSITQTKVNLITEPFSSGDKMTTEEKLLKKGQNSIIIKRIKDLQVITFQQGERKLILLK